MPLDPETITQQLELLAAHRRTLAHLLQQAAQFGGAVFAPPQTANGIAEARAEIGRIKVALRDGGLPVEDEPNDEGPPISKPVQRQQVASRQVNAQQSQGFINQASGPVSQNFGEQTNIDTGGGPAIVGNQVGQGNIIGVQNVFNQPSLAPALHQLRAPVSDFVGREQEIDQLVQALSKAASGGATAAISGVRGMGGIGKSELAYMVAHRLKDTFPDAQLLVELRGASSSSLTSEQALQRVIYAFERGAKLPDDLSELQGIYRSILSGKRVLILADDAGDTAQVRPLLPPPGCALLVTSRHRFSLPGMVVFDLGALPPKEAEELLLSVYPRIGEHVGELAKLCGYLPLALRVSASLLRENDSRDVYHYLEQLRAERLKHLSDPDNADDPQASVEASLRLSYDTLEPPAQCALCQMSVFPVSFWREAAQAVVVVEGDIVGVLELLHRRSLLDWDTALERYSLHELVRAFAAARLEDADAVRLRHAWYYAVIADTAQNFYNQGGAALLIGLTLFDQERMHIDAGWEWALANGGNTEVDALLLHYANATAHVGDLRYDRRRVRIPQLEAAVAAAQRLKNRSQEGAALGNLGVAYAALGEARTAIDFHKQVLAIDREIGDRRGEGNALGNLGRAYAALGEARTAIDFCEQALVIGREIGDRRGEGNALGNLGDAYYALGKARTAIDFFEQWRVIAHEIGDRRGEGAALGNLGLAYAALGEARTAIDFFEQHLTVAREIGDQRGEGIALGNLGNAYYALGDARKAIDFFEQSLVIAREIGDRRGEGAALGNLGMVCGSLGEVRTAIDFFEQHLVVAREIGDQRGEGNALGNLGLAYATLGDTRQAITFYEQRLAIAREIGDWGGGAITSWNLGLALEQQGELARAAEMMQVRVDYERAIGHTDAEKHASELDHLSQRLAASQSPPPADAPDEA